MVEQDHRDAEFVEDGAEQGPLVIVAAHGRRTDEGGQAFSTFPQEPFGESEFGQRGFRGGGPVVRVHRVRGPQCGDPVAQFRDRVF